jgi:hypothetical protein
MLALTMTSYALYRDVRFGGTSPSVLGTPAAA